MMILLSLESHIPSLGLLISPSPNISGTELYSPIFYSLITIDSWYLVLTNINPSRSQSRMVYDYLQLPRTESIVMLKLCHYSQNAPNTFIFCINLYSIFRSQMLDI